MCNCSISNCLYIFDMTELIFVACSLAIVDFGNKSFEHFKQHQITITSCIYFICYSSHFWLVLNSNFVNITNFTLSKFKYLIFTKLKLLSLSSHSIMQGSSSCCTSCIALFSHSDLWPCLCFCILLQTTPLQIGSFSFIPYVWHCFWVPSTTIFIVFYYFLLL